MAFKYVIVSSGDPAGVGPDLCLRLAQQSWPAPPVVIADLPTLQARQACLGLSKIKLRLYQPDAHPPALNTLDVIPLALPQPAKPGQSEQCHAKYILSMLDLAMTHCQDHPQCLGMLTAPVNKAAINRAGFAFSGHTEYLAAHTQTQHVVMLLANRKLCVALLTTHIPLFHLKQALSSELIQKTLKVIHHHAPAWLKRQSIRIAVAGVNPHASDGGYIGNEESEIIEPALKIAQAQGIDCAGPFSADTLFLPQVSQDYDLILAMYHDQGLPVFKYADFGGGINITLGLPFARVSVDHGTAYALAGTHYTQTSSMLYAMQRLQQYTPSHAHTPPT